VFSLILGIAPTVISVCDAPIPAVAANGYHTVGLRSDGMVVVRSLFLKYAMKLILEQGNREKELSNRPYVLFYNQVGLMTCNARIQVLNAGTGGAT
jgi:hypothetical protein